jgi:hypothetical protein
MCQIEHRAERVCVFNKGAMPIHNGLCLQEQPVYLAQMNVIADVVMIAVAFNSSTFQFNHRSICFILNHRSRRPVHDRGRGYMFVILNGSLICAMTSSWWALVTLLPCHAWHGRELTGVSRQPRSALSITVGKALYGGVLKIIYVRY